MFVFSGLFLQHLFVLCFISGRANHLLLLLEEDPRGSQLSSPPQTSPPACLPPHQDANCFDSRQHSLTPPLQRVLWVYLTPSVSARKERRRPDTFWCWSDVFEVSSLFQWTSAQPAKMTLTAKTANRSWRATPAATVSPPVRPRSFYRHSDTVCLAIPVLIGISVGLQSTALCDRWASEDVRTNLIKSDMSPQLVPSLHLIILPLFPHSWLSVPGSHLICHHNKGG